MRMRVLDVVLTPLPFSFVTSEITLLPPNVGELNCAHRRPCPKGSPTAATDAWLALQADWRDQQPLAATAETLSTRRESVATC